MNIKNALNNKITLLNALSSHQPTLTKNLNCKGGHVMIGQTNLFDDVLKTEERFVIVVQVLEEKNGKLLKRTLREYSSLTHEQMESLFQHLKELYSETDFEASQSAFAITVYTNLDYAADQVYAHIKRHRGKHEWTHTAK